MRIRGEYEHTQFATTIIVMLLIGASLAIAISLRAGEPTPLVMVVAVAGGVVLLFNRLTVNVGEELLEARFGPGLIRRRIALADIRRAEAISIPWFYGWGVRRTPRGWLFRVSGLEVVEVTLVGGKRFLIGTDEPHELVRAIELRRPDAGQHQV